MVTTRGRGHAHGRESPTSPASPTRPPISAVAYAVRALDTNRRGACRCHFCQHDVAWAARSIEFVEFPGLGACGTCIRDAAARIARGESACCNPRLARTVQLLEFGLAVDENGVLAALRHAPCSPPPPEIEQLDLSWFWTAHDATVAHEGDGGHG